MLRNLRKASPTARRMFHAQLGRWLTEREKLAASGLAVSEEQACAAGIRGPVPWDLDMGWHSRVGNGNQLQNIGLVLMAVLGSLKLREKAPQDILEIQAPSFPDGLSKEGKNFKLLVGTKTFNLGTSKVFAHEVHKKVHVTCLKPIHRFP